MLGLLKPKKKNYPSTKKPTTINDLREGMVKVMNEIYEEEGRMPTRNEIRSRLEANYVAISKIREEWWATIQPTISVDESDVDESDVEDAVVVNQDNNLSDTASSFEATDVTPPQESKKTVEEQIEEAYQKGVKDGKVRTKKRVRVPNAQ